MIFQEKYYEGQTFEKLNIEEDLLGITFDNCLFKNCIFNEQNIAICKFTECIFERCYLALIKLKNCIFNDIKILNCKAIGINWSSSYQPFLINIYNSNISDSSFFNLDLSHSEIISCNAHNVDFTEANLQKANFSETDLLQARFLKTNLKFTDFSNAKNYSIDATSNTLQSTKVSFPEAISFLKYLDIKIIN